MSRPAHAYIPSPVASARPAEFPTRHNKTGTPYRGMATSELKLEWEDTVHRKDSNVISNHVHLLGCMQTPVRRVWTVRSDIKLKLAWSRTSRTRFDPRCADPAERSESGQFLGEIVAAIIIGAKNSDLCCDTVYSRLSIYDSSEILGSVIIRYIGDLQFQEFIVDSMVVSSAMTQFISGIVIVSSGFP